MTRGIDRSGARRPAGYGPTARVARDLPERGPDDRVVEYDAQAWPRKVRRESMLVPTVCFNCESACGLMAYVDTATFEIRKLVGSPDHPGSRGRNCAKGPATLNQITDPERILYPMRRKGPRGGGQWERVSWDHVLDTFAERMHDAFAAGRNNDVHYFVGRPGEDGFAERFLETWGCDGHNSHTNVCSSGGRTGYGFWSGTDRPSPDYANARFILLISAHLESGHYFNPHAQRIVEGQQRGAKIAVVDPRLSNTAARADYWLPAWPGTEGAVLLAMAKVMLDEDLFDKEFMRRWVNWRTYLAHRAPDDEPTFPNFIAALKAEYAHRWHQKVRARRAQPGDRYADIHVDHARARMVYRKWRSLARPAIGELRRPIWLFRPLKPVLDAYRLPDDEQTRAARAAADTERPSPSEFHKLVDWSPEKEWGPLDG